MSSFNHFLRGLASQMPLNFLRVIFFKILGVRLGKGVMVGRGTILGEEVTLGNGSRVGSNSKLVRANLGKDVLIQDRTVIWDSIIGDESKVLRGSILAGDKDLPLELGKDVTIGYFWFLDGIGGLKIEDHVDIGGNGGGIFTHSSIRKRLLGLRTSKDDRIMKKTVKIGTCSWLGAGVIVQLGVDIGHHSVVMPGSVVTKDIEPYTMVGGVPAKVLKRIVIEDGDVKFHNILEG